MVDSVTVTEGEDGQRLDRWLKKRYPATTFGNLQKILRTGQVRVDGKRVRGDARLTAGQIVRVPPQLTAPVKTDKTLSKKDVDFIQSIVLYKDDHIIALNKPAGLATQGGTKITRHVDGLLDGLAFGGPRPHLVHRLDKDTSGVLLLARSPKAAKAMGDVFRGRDIRKYYWAITAPAPLQHQGKIKSVIGKEDGDDGEKVRPTEGGKTAITYYQVLETAHDKLAFVAFWPLTGRTHQIRVHALEMGCPLLGDYKYAPQPILDENKDIAPMLCLHARRVIFRHPVTGKRIDVTAPLDPRMKKTWAFFGFSADDTSDPFETLV